MPQVKLSIYVTEALYATNGHDGGNVITDSYFLTFQDYSDVPFPKEC